MIAATYFPHRDTLGNGLFPQFPLLEWDSPTLTWDSNEVHVWYVPLDLIATFVQILQKTLTPDEQKRVLLQKIGEALSVALKYV